MAVAQIFQQIRKAITQLNPNEVRQAAERPLLVRLVAPSEAAYEEMESFLLPDSISRERLDEIRRYLRWGGEEAASRDEIVIYHRDSPGPAGRLLFDPAKPHALVRRVLAERQEQGLALARCFPPFREPVTERIIHTISRENALFSLTTALPNILPGLMTAPLGITEAASDTVVLTVNQIRMAFLLAAASDRNLGYGEQKTEIASLIAGAFGWRALARELAGKLPFGGGLIPKAAIAFAGTYVVGRSLERYYRIGYGFTRAERREAYEEAFERGKQVAAALLEGLRKPRREDQTQSPS
jgi:hypothetical protein